MSSRTRRKAPCLDSNNDEELGNTPPKIEPYTVLQLERSATSDQIKSAYRKAALKHHPDKVPAERKEEAHKKFQEIAFAYAILSDSSRRKRYDLTGSTSESLTSCDNDDNDDEFNWATYFKEQFKEVITADAIEEFSKVYKGSTEERGDLITAYKESKGQWMHIYEVVMLSDPLEDEERFRAIIDKAIQDGELEAYKSYTNETKKAKKRRMDARLKEREELAEMAEAVGAEALLKAPPAESEDTLKALIHKNQAGRKSFIDHLEAKYAQPKVKNKGLKGKSSGKRKQQVEAEEDDNQPSEEAFLATRKRLESQKNVDRKTKRAKR